MKVMRRTYTGARGRLPIDAVQHLPRSRYAVQPKVDGVYVELRLDERGRIARGLTRSGRTAARLLADLCDVELGSPGAVLVGELEALTERSLRARTLRGWHNCHLLDLLHDGTRDLAAAPYAERRDALQRMVATWADGRGVPWDDDASGRAHGEAGRYVRRVRRDWTRFPVVPQWAPGAAEVQATWEAAQQGAAEGLVVVALAARAGARGAKQKVKPIDHLDAAVVRVSPRTVLLRELETGEHFAVARSTWNLRPGALVEVAHEGEYRGGAPRFPRIVRLRPDLC